MYIGKKIIQLREDNDLTQKELAESLNINRSVLNRIEQGTRPVRDDELKKMSDFFDVPSDYLIGRIPKGKGFFEYLLKKNNTKTHSAPTSEEAIIHSYKIPILGRVAAGIPIEAHEEILGYQYINEEYRNDGYSYFALRICGKSMEPTIMDGDIVVVRQQTTVDSGDIAIVIIDGEDATAKEVKESPEGITLIGHNVAVYTPHFYSNKDIQELPVQIIGKVIQAIRKF